MIRKANKYMVNRRVNERTKHSKMKMSSEYGLVWLPINRLGQTVVASEGEKVKRIVEEGR